MKVGVLWVVLVLGRRCVVSLEGRRRGAVVPGALDLALRTVFTGLYNGSCVRQSSSVESMKFLVAGAVSGVVSRTLVSPLEVVATVNMASEGQVGGVVDELRCLWIAEGVGGFFKGNGANCLKVAPTKGIQFVTFECLKGLRARWRRWRGGKASDFSPVDRLVAGGFAGVVAAACVYPLETLKSILTVERKRYGHRSIFASFALIVKETGFFNLYRGLVPTLIAMMPYVGIEFCAYETFKQFLLTVELRNTTKLSTLETMLIGAAAGAVAQSSCHPLDVVRKRLQLQGLNGRPLHYTNMLDGLSGIAKAEGLNGLYKGIVPACLATVPSTGSSYVVYEAVKRVLGIASR